MKRIKILLQVFLVTLLVLSCTKNEEQLNENQTLNISSVNIALLGKTSTNLLNKYYNKSSSKKH